MPTLRLQDQDVYYRWTPASSEEGFTFVFIHGLGSSHSFYETVTPHLIESGHSCLALDTPGSGLSKYAGRDRKPSEIAGLIAALISKLKLESRRFIAVGHSMGAMVASELALQIPLSGVVLIGPVHPTPALGDIFAARIQTIQEKGLESLADSIPKAATGSQSTSSHHAFIRALINSQSPEGYMSLCHTIATASPPEYSKVKAPLLIIAGGEDKTSPLAGCQAILDSWGTTSGKKIEILDGVGHWHCIEAPDRVQLAMSKFAGSLS
ncbi:unnamed protein product [Clonostachys byssicola]|uniref:AB hydrolase-1 domain-containing protein n=1 Tax=Clonostachys byssicola TaxID=160290 RepID=A0A9N9URG1_9HYPO|nr:unnamed protein product [Clonostachys byssicola]